MGAAAELFYSTGADETLNKRVRPSEDQFDYLRRKKDDLQEWLEIDIGNRTGLAVSAFLQGSYRFHTLIRPLAGKDFDVDLGIYIEWSSSAVGLSARSCREHVQSSAQEFASTDQEVKDVVDPPKDRCIRLLYKNSFHIDVPVYHRDEEEELCELAVGPNQWESSNPRLMLEWFEYELGGLERAQVRRIIRYFKAWVALKYKEEQEVPSSLMLTVLVIDALNELNVPDDSADDDVMRLVVQSIHQRLESSTVVENPVEADSDDDLNRLSEQGNRILIARLGELVNIASRATEEEDVAGAAVIWSEAFDYLFPLPQESAIATESAPGSGIAVLVPRVAIAVHNRLDEPPQRTFYDTVPFVRVGQKLRFSIVDPTVLPAGAQVRWVVRNEGRQAYAKNDLGHSQEGANIHDENVAYLGRHYMDCEIRLHGRIYSVTRIPVNVSGSMPPRHSPPAFRRPALLKGRGR